MNSFRHIQMIAKNHRSLGARRAHARASVGDMSKDIGAKFWWLRRRLHRCAPRAPGALFTCKRQGVPRQRCAPAAITWGLGGPKTIRHVRRHGRYALLNGITRVVSTDERSGFATPVTLN